MEIIYFVFEQIEPNFGILDHNGEPGMILLARGASWFIERCLIALDHVNWVFSESNMVDSASACFF